MRKEVIIVFFIAIFALLLIFIPSNSKNTEITVSGICNDGTFYDTCSLNKPYYCEEGILVEKSSVCGCPENFSKNGEECSSIYETNSKQFSFTYFLDGEENQIELEIYQGVSNYASNLPRTIEYQGEEISSRRDFTLQKIDEELQREFIMPLVVEIINRAEAKDDQARIAISLVQNIPFGYSEKKGSFEGQEVEYVRYPYEVLYDFEGICEEKTNLLSFLLREIGYGSSLIYYGEENHVALGIKCPVGESLEDSGYCFVETSGPALITDDELTYAGGITLNSVPNIELISNGDALGSNLQEYRDAEDSIKIKKKLRGKNVISIFKNSRLERINEYYGITGEYNV